MPQKPINKKVLQKKVVNFTLALLVLLIAGGYLSYMRYQEYFSANDYYEFKQMKMADLQANLTTLTDDYNKTKKTFDQENSALNVSLQKVLPTTESYTNLARELDNYFLTNNTTDNPIFLSDLRFNPARFEDKKDYGVLPFSMTISASQDSFKKFLKYVATSGDLNTGTRLMDISSISINFDNSANSGATTTDTTANSESGLINVSMAMNAYFQKSNLK